MGPIIILCTSDARVLRRRLRPLASRTAADLGAAATMVRGSRRRAIVVHWSRGDEDYSNLKAAGDVRFVLYGSRRPRRLPRGACWFRAPTYAGPVVNAIMRLR
jgi:hypothetical protein